MNDIFSFIDKLELISFFSGYLIVLTFVSIIANRYQSINWVVRLKNILPKSYGVIGLLYLGLKLQQYLPTLIKYPLSTIQLRWDFLHLLAYFSFIFLFTPSKIGYKISLFHGSIYSIIALFLIFQFGLTHTIDHSFKNKITYVFLISILLNFSILFILFIIDRVKIRIRKPVN
jgi:hypothetical protein